MKLVNKDHLKKVTAISRQISAFSKQKKPFRVYHGSTNSTRILTFNKDQMVDISQLNHVLSVDPDKRTTIVEPNVPMDKLVKATLKHGLIPPVVMEFPGITVGGAIQGNGGESSSFKWGAFNQIFNWYEIITGDGKTVRASRDEGSQLFHAIPGTAGTLGLLTAAELQLIPAKRYVELVYTPVISFSDAKSKIEGATKQNVDFVDGIMFSKDSGVVIVGELRDGPTAKVERFSRAHDQWYYLHVEETFAAHKKGWHEMVPLVDYLFRYDRGAFWVGRFAFDMFNVPYTRFMRWLLNPILHTRKLYQALQESGQSQHHVVQDLVLPANSFVKFCTFIDKELQTYPLWLCPMLPDKDTTFQLNNLPAKSIINVGVWGVSIPEYHEFIRVNRAIETRLLELGGKKWSYAHSYFSDKEFWSMYDKKHYDSLRKKYHATYLPNLYDKLSVREHFPIQRKKALLKTILGTARLKIK